MNIYTDKRALRATTNYGRNASYLEVYHHTYLHRVGDANLNDFTLGFGDESGLMSQILMHSPPGRR